VRFNCCDSLLLISNYQNNNENICLQNVLIVDARSYTTAVANRARGGGCECPEYYPRCDISFMNLANIHAVRKAAQALRALLASDAADQPK
jgi:myotubularin-related protein 3/4